MTSDTTFQLLLRALPAILVFALGFLAVNDIRTRRQWTQFLFSIGSLRADQREDAKKQSSVKWPFFAFALILLWWPISYYRLATRTFEVGAESDLFKKSATPAPLATNTPEPTPSGPTPPPAPLAPGQTAPAPTALAPAAAPVTSQPAGNAAQKPAPVDSGAGPHL